MNGPGFQDRPGVIPPPVNDPFPPVPPRDDEETICAGCWRRQLLAAHKRVPHPLRLCSQCSDLLDSWYRYGDGAEGARHGDRMVAAWVKQTASRREYARAVR